MNCCAASMGPFTVNLWERANATDQDGDLFEYIYSHSAYATRDDFANVDAFHPNQVRLHCICTSKSSCVPSDTLRPRCSCLYIDTGTTTGHKSCSIAW